MIAIWHEGALGDLLLSRLAFRVIRKKHPEEKIFLFARQEARFLFVEAGLVDKALPTSLSLINERISLLYLFSHTRSLKELLSPFVRRLIPVSTRPQGRLHLALQEAISLGTLPEGGLFLKERTSQGEFLLLHPGSGAPYKCLPPFLWRRLGEEWERRGEKIIFLLGPAEEGLKEYFPPEKTVLSFSVRETVKIILKTRAFLGHDSGLSHLAAALGAPTLAIFGPTPWWHWAPFGRVMVGKVACSCLEEKRDPHTCNPSCLKRLSFKSLFSLSELFLNTTARSGLPGVVEPGLAPHFRSQPVEGAEVEDSFQRLEEPEMWVPELGIQVVEVAGEHFLKG